MREVTALELAVGLLQLPSRARTLREGALPHGVDTLLNVVAGEGQVLADAARTAGLSEGSIRDAASFYIEQILLHPDADSYRALGTSPDATTDELRRNMALLLRWLHPDREANSARSIYVGRVTEAWNNLKTAERRALYDEAQKIAGRGKATGSAPRADAHGRAVIRNGHAPAQMPRGVRTKSTGYRGRGTLRRRSIWRILGRLLGQDRL